MTVNTIPPGTKLIAQYSLPDWKIKVGKTYKVHYNNGKAMIFVGGFFDTEGVYLEDMMVDDLKVFGI